MKTTKLLFCAVSIAAALVAAKAHSQTLTATYTIVSPGFGVNGTVNGDSPGPFFQDYPAGVMKFTSFDAFCVEPLQLLEDNTTLVYEITSTSSLTNSDSVARLIGGFLASGQTAQDAAAVQWAIWEVVNESSGNPFSLSAGNVRITTDTNTINLADTFLANMGTYTPASLTYLTSTDKQDVVTWNLVPEPGSAALAALSVVVLAGRRRRH